MDYSLADLIKYLKTLEVGRGRSVENTQSLIEAAEVELSYFRDDFLKEAIETIRLAMFATWEVQNYPKIFDELETILTIKVKSSLSNFLSLSGLRVAGNGRVSALTPDLKTVLGDFQDWKAMQQAGRGAFNTGKEDTGAAGWRGHYINWLSRSYWDSNDAHSDFPDKHRKWKKKRAHIYPAIMHARFAWARSNNKAPYWYWYDKDVGTDKAFPRQNPKNITNLIKNISEKYALLINRNVEDSYKIPENNPAQVAINTGKIAEDTEDWLSSWLEESAPVSEPVYKMVVEFSGTFRFPGDDRVINASASLITTLKEQGLIVEVDQEISNNKTVIKYRFAKGKRGPNNEPLGGRYTGLVRTTRLVRTD